MRTVKRSALTWVSLAAFLVFFCAGGLALARPLTLLIESLRHEAIFLEQTLRPWLFGPLLLGWVILGYWVIHAHLAPRRLSRPVAAAFLCLCSGIVLLRMRPPTAVHPKPAKRAEMALEAAQTRIEAASAGQEHLPLSFPGEARLFDAGGRPLETGFLGHGKQLLFKVVSLEPAAGAPLSARADDPPGTLYYRVDERSQTRFWLTVLVLGAHPVGPVRFLRDLDGKPVVIEGTLQNPSK